MDTAYAFFHQKLRIYTFSTLDWQKDDIEYAIAQFVTGMDQDLYARLARGRQGFLLEHTSFATDLAEAVDELEKML